MIGASFTFIEPLGKALVDYFFTSNTNIKASPKALKQAIKDRGKDVLQCKFIEGEKIYSALEYAVKVQDEEAARTLIEFGSPVDKLFTRHATIVHFYVACLKEEQTPNLNLLNLLLDQLADVDHEGFNFLTPLEYALKQMSPYKQIHWGVIKTLFKRGARIEEKFYTTPFEVLKDSQCDVLYFGKKIRPLEEEIRFLKHLKTYIEIEKQYHPKSESGLTWKEFKCFTTVLNDAISVDAIFRDSSTWLSLDVSTLNQELEEILSSVPLPAGEKKELKEWKEVFELVEHKIKDVAPGRPTLEDNLNDYYLFFKSLVKEKDKTFSDCFEPWQRTMIGSVLKEIQDKQDKNKT